MPAPFPFPPRSTALRSFTSPTALEAALARKNGWIVLDEGVPLPLRLGDRAVFRLPGGEGCKRWATLEKLLVWLAEAGAERSQPLVVIGGGATLDLAALAASLYRRGMPLVLVPTTLLGMVDATLGGKTAVDLELGGRLRKNFAGTFYPASEAWIAPGFLSTLPLRERVSGAGEAYKTLWIRGRGWDERSLLAFVREAKTGPALGRLVHACLETKAKVVARDPFDEKRVREVLNFGHTVGHALEAASGRSHGECVLWGMAVETALLGKTGAAMARECARAIAALGLSLPPELESLPEVEWEALLGSDKKARQERIELTLLPRPGKTARKRLSPREVARAIRAFPGSFRRAGVRPPA